jgi:hypothetical protein
MLKYIKLFLNHKSIVTSDYIGTKKFSIVTNPMIDVDFLILRLNPFFYLCMNLQVYPVSEGQTRFPVGNDFILYLKIPLLGARKMYLTPHQVISLFIMESWFIRSSQGMFSIDKTKFLG